MASRFLGYVQQHIVGFVALCVALGGTSYAVTTQKFVSSDGRVTACAKTSNGAVRLVAAGRKCRKGEERVTWNQTGQTGARGLQGAAGAAGPQGPAGERGPTGERGPDGSIQGAAAGGDLTGSYPAPRLAAAEAPRTIADNPGTVTDPCDDVSRTLVYCGTSTARWLAGGFGIDGLQTWLDRSGTAHLRGSAARSSGNLGTGGIIVFRLPEELRPKRFMAFPIATGQNAGVNASGEAIAVVYPSGQGAASGAVAIYSPSDGTDTVIHLGEISFRVDA